MKNINEILLNPIRMRIIQNLSSGQSITATELCGKMSDIPRTTVYRHISILIDNNILSIVSEKRIRGSLERTIALNIPEIARHNTIENGAQNAFGFLMTQYAKFHNYFHGENPDPTRDRIFLNNMVLMMSDAEFGKFIAELRGIVLKYNFEPGSRRKARDLSIISSPAE
jgi:DNA-binding transcriptional ArsR family regulator